MLKEYADNMMTIFQLQHGLLPTSSRTVTAVNMYRVIAQGQALFQSHTRKTRKATNRPKVGGRQEPKHQPPPTWPALFPLCPMPHFYIN